jgi:putative lipoprotein
MKNLFLATIAALAFYGCAGITSSVNIAEQDVSNIDVPEDNWTRYLGTDGAIREVAFLTAFFSRDFRAQPADGEPTGFALTKTDGARLPFRLGAVYKSGDSAFMLKDADTEAEFDLKDETSATRLRGARRIKFYEFSSNLTTVAVFEAPISVCEAFQKGGSVSVKSVSSYYDTHILEKRYFTAVITQAKISSKSGALLLKSQIKNFTNLNGLQEVAVKTHKFEEKIQNELRGYGPRLSQICSLSEE